jgi:hypothetical protein
MKAFPPLPDGLSQNPSVSPALMRSIRRRVDNDGHQLLLIDRY